MSSSIVLCEYVRTYIDLPILCMLSLFLSSLSLSLSVCKSCAYMYVCMFLGINQLAIQRCIQLVITL